MRTRGWWILVLWAYLLPHVFVMVGGLPPSPLLCSQGYYMQKSPKEGCSPCPSGTGTITEGSTTISDCSSSHYYISRITGPQVVGLCEALVLDGGYSTGRGRGSALQYEWAVKGRGAALLAVAAKLAEFNGVNAQVITIPSSDLQAGAMYNFTLRVTNTVSRRSDESSLVVSKSPLDIPQLEVEGGYTRVAHVRETTVITARGRNPACSSASNSPLTYKWYPSGSDPSGYDADISLSPSPDPRSLVLAPETLQVGVRFFFTVVASLASNSKLNNTQTVSIVVVSEGLEAAIAGGNRLVSTSSTLPLDGSPSLDLDADKFSIMRYRWTCYVDGGTACTARLPNGNVAPLNLVSLARVIVPKGALSPNKVYTFQLVVEKGLRGSPSFRNATTSVEIVTTAAVVPSVSIKSVAGAAREVTAGGRSVHRIPPSSPVLIGGEVASSGDNVTLRWEAASGVDLKCFASPVAGQSVKILPQYLTAGSLYTFTLYALSVSGEGAASVTVVINSSPYDGYVTCTSRSVSSLTANGLRLFAANWIDEAEDYPLMYKFAIESTVTVTAGQGATETELPLSSSFSEARSMYAPPLPPGDWRAVVYVSDALGATGRSSRDIDGREVVVAVVVPTGDKMTDSYIGERLNLLLPQLSRDGQVDYFFPLAGVIASILRKTTPADPIAVEARQALKARIVTAAETAMAALHVPSSLVGSPVQTIASSLASLSITPLELLTSSKVKIVNMLSNIMASLRDNEDSSLDDMSVLSKVLVAIDSLHGSTPVTSEFTEENFSSAEQIVEGVRVSMMKGLLPGETAREGGAAAHIKVTVSKIAASVPSIVVSTVDARGGGGGRSEYSLSSPHGLAPGGDYVTISTAWWGNTVNGKRQRFRRVVSSGVNVEAGKSVKGCMQQTTSDVFAFQIATVQGSKTTPLNFNSSLSLSPLSLKLPVPAHLGGDVTCRIWDGVKGVWSQERMIISSLILDENQEAFIVCESTDYARSLFVVEDQVSTSALAVPSPMMRNLSLALRYNTFNFITVITVSSVVLLYILCASVYYICYYEEYYDNWYETCIETYSQWGVIGVPLETGKVVPNDVTHRFITGMRNHHCWISIIAHHPWDRVLLTHMDRITVLFTQIVSRLAVAAYIIGTFEFTQNHPFLTGIFSSVCIGPVSTILQSSFRSFNGLRSDSFSIIKRFKRRRRKVTAKKEAKNSFISALKQKGSDTAIANPLSPGDLYREEINDLVMEYTSDAVYERKMLAFRSKKKQDDAVRVLIKWWRRLRKTKIYRNILIELRRAYLIQHGMINEKGDRWKCPKCLFGSNLVSSYKCLGCNEPCKDVFNITIESKKEKERLQAVRRVERRDRIVTSSFQAAAVIFNLADLTLSSYIFTTCFTTPVSNLTLAVSATIFAFGTLTTSIGLSGALLHNKTLLLLSIALSMVVFPLFLYLGLSSSAMLLSPQGYYLFEKSWYDFHSNTLGSSSDLEQLQESLLCCGYLDPQDHPVNNCTGVLRWYAKEGGVTVSNISTLAPPDYRSNEVSMDWGLTALRYFIRQSHDFEGPIGRDGTNMTADNLMGCKESMALFVLRTVRYVEPYMISMTVLQTLLSAISVALLSRKKVLKGTKSKRVIPALYVELVDVSSKEAHQAATIIQSRYRALVSKRRFQWRKEFINWFVEGSVSLTVGTVLIYCLAFAIAAFAIFINIIYGLQFTTDQSSAWLVAGWLAVFLEAVVQQPVLIFIRSALWKN